MVAELVQGSGDLGGVVFDPNLLTDPSEGAYLQRDGVNYWTQSGRVFFDPANFYLPERAQDPFGNEAWVTYDAFALLVTDTRDALGNQIHADHDYRVLSPLEVVDPNLNRTQVAYDALGMLVKTAVMGKSTETLGDTLDNPTTLFEYDLLRWQTEQKPVFAKTTARELHVHQQASTPTRVSFAYSDGFGRVVMQKVQAEPGEVPGMTGTIDPRWVGTGRTVFNNKGNPIKQYEPFFSSTSDFEDEEAIVEAGVTPIVHYDPLDRVIRTELPDGSETRVEFDAWQQTTYDQNDAIVGSAWLTRYQSGTPDEQLAATRTLAHANTPTVVHLDTLGRPFRSIAHNRTGGVDAFFHTRTELDIEGNTLSIIDARQHEMPTPVPTITHVFDVLARRLSVVSADAGTRWMVADTAGKPLRAWDSRGHTLSAKYDALQRPTQMLVDSGSGNQVMTRTVYGEALDPTGPAPTDASSASLAQALNLRGRPYLVFDGAGLVASDSVDFKGNVTQARRRIAPEYLTTPHWTALPDPGTAANLEADAISAGLLEGTEDFTSVTEFDALNRVRTATTPDNSVTRPVYNEAGLLEQIHVSVKGATETPVVTSIDYNARGQRTAIQYQNGVSTTYTYDEFTFRLATLVSNAGGTALQNLTYTYDPVGNIIALRDGLTSHPAISGSNLVSADGLYIYDALYRLVSAEGREHPGIEPVDLDPDPLSTLPHPNDTQALTRYTETYTYDEVGNIQSMQHSGANGWTRNYAYATDNNRLTATSVPGSPLNISQPYTYDPHGSMVSMPNIQQLDWDYADRLQHTSKSTGSGQDTYFTYDATGQRVRKVYVHNGLFEERIYLGGYEIYRRRANTAGSPADLERETLHVSDDQRRIAMVETETTGAATPRFLRLCHR